MRDGVIDVFYEMMKFISDYNKPKSNYDIKKYIMRMDFTMKKVGF